MTASERLDPEVAGVAALVPFDEVTADLLPSLRARFEMPGSDLVERTDQSYPGTPRSRCASAGPRPRRAHCRASTQCTAAAM